MARCDSYVFGECTWGACEAQGWVPEGLGDAWMWLADAQNLGFNTSQLPTTNAVVVYGQGHGYSSFGHCGIVLDPGDGNRFLVYEMNFVAWDQYDQRWSDLSGVAGFILPPGVSPPPSPPGPPRGAPGGGGDVAFAWSQLTIDWNHTLPGHVNQELWVKATADQF